MTDYDQISMINENTLPFCIAANVVSDRKLRTGARVLIVRWTGNEPHPVVIGLNKFGRRIIKHAKWHRLTNFRPARVPKSLWERSCAPKNAFDHAPRFAAWCVWQTKQDAQRECDLITSTWDDCSRYTPDGSELQWKGKSVCAAERAWLNAH